MYNKTKAFNEVYSFIKSLCCHFRYITFAEYIVIKLRLLYAFDIHTELELFSSILIASDNAKNQN